MTIIEFNGFTNGTNPLSAESKNLLQRHAALLPHAFLHSRQVSIEILTSKWDNVQCPYHRWVSKIVCTDCSPNPQVRDYFYVTGSPGICIRAVGANEKNPPPRTPGYLHCGCQEDEVLLELILWKLTLQQSPTTGRIKTWQNQFLEPCAHTFSLCAFTFWSGLSVDDFFKYDDEGTFRANVYLRLLQRQIEFLGARYRRVKTASDKGGNWDDPTAPLGNGIDSDDEMNMDMQSINMSLDLP
ncbi:hypothetical protein NP233_g6508 [Leucocoprinus birnbaumii]|uniref:Uncharacterized protein n=1 Tax=Leucocoprinus birnbaumii TaxID=56174 RepID=A0AAD5VT73_9AGAR|nr:hypothetical protein NP233_g6508 [Leucocoprinus birnbaumii]